MIPIIFKAYHPNIGIYGKQFDILYKEDFTKKKTFQGNGKTSLRGSSTWHHITDRQTKDSVTLKTTSQNNLGLHKLHVIRIRLNI